MDVKPKLDITAATRYVLRSDCFLSVLSLARIWLSFKVMMISFSSFSFLSIALVVVVFALSSPTTRQRVEGLRRRRTGDLHVRSGVKNRTQPAPAPEPARRNEPRGGTAAAEMLASMPRFAHGEKEERDGKEGLGCENNEVWRDWNVKLKK